MFDHQILPKMLGLCQVLKHNPDVSFFEPVSFRTVL